MKLLRTSLFMVAGALLLAACSDTTATDTPATDTEAVVPTDNGVSAVDSTEPINTTGSPTTTIGDITDVAHPPASGDFVGALVDVSGQTCEQESAGWRVTGIVTNPTTSPVDYRVYISLLNGASTTRALVETELLAVAPSADAMFDELVALPDDDLRCVLRVERRAPGN